MWSFYSPTRGNLTLEQVVDDILHEAQRSPKQTYRLMIGTDSQPYNGRKSVKFVSAIILHRVGKGARYYIHREFVPHLYSLRQRMFTEAAYSLQLGSMLSDALHQRGEDWQMEVHLDIGDKGATKQLIREIVAWIQSSGYETRIKPDSFCASKVADRYTKI